MPKTGMKNCPLTWAALRMDDVYGFAVTAGVAQAVEFPAIGVGFPGLNLKVFNVNRA